jgi:DNA polymerase III gamma/tau subunit
MTAQSKFDTFIQQSPKEVTPEIVRSLLKLLTNQQQSVLYALHDAGAALTTKQLRNFIISDLVASVIKLHIQWEKEQLKYQTKDAAIKAESMAHRLQALMGRMDSIATQLQRSHNPQPLQTAKEAKKEFEQKGQNAITYMEHLLKFWGYDKSKDYLHFEMSIDGIEKILPAIIDIFTKHYVYSKEIEEFNKLFSSINVEIPSFRTFNTILESLARDNYVIKQTPSESDESEKKKTIKIKAWWSIHPKVDIYLNKLDVEEGKENQG